jgi:hypothetical protein
MEEQLREIIDLEVSAEKNCNVQPSMFRRCGDCIRVNIEHFQHLL